MREYVLRRLVSMVPVLFIVSLISFALLYILPGDPALAMLGENAGTQETYRSLRRELGLDDPLIVQYGRWLWRTVQGDLGRSIRTRESVAEVLGRRVPTSLTVGLAGLLFGIVLGLSEAIISALRPGSKIDMLGTFMALGGAALPTFWQALLFMYLFAVMLRWLPPTGYTSPLDDPWLSAKTLFMPPTATWGSMLRTGSQYLEVAPWLAFAPGVAIFLTVLAFNFVGDGLRRALDPRLLSRRRG
jgi:peptide/nickel transport system permease protein